MAVTVAQRRSLSIAQAKRKRADILATGERMANRAAPVGTLAPDTRITRTFETIGEPDTSGAEGFGAEYRIGEANATLAREQGISPVFNGKPLGEAVQMDSGYGFYDDAGNFQHALETDHVLLMDRTTGRLSVFPRSEATEEGHAMGVARMVLGGAAGGAPTRMAGGGASAVARRAPSAAAETVAAFDRAAVDPSLVTALQNRATSIGANVLRNTPAGGPIERGIRGNIAQAGQGVERTAATLTDVGDASTAGARIRTSASEFVKATVPRRQEALYGTADRLIGDAGKTFVPRTLQALDGLEAEISNPAIREFITDPNVSGLAQTIRTAAPGGISFSDLRRFRTDIRGLKSSQEGKVGINKTAISRIYNAMTKDMEGMALAQGGDEALGALKRADLFTYRMMGEAGDMQSTSAPVRLLRELTDGRADEAIYSTMRQWSGRGAGADVAKLDMVKRAVLRTDSKQAWTDFTGAFLRNMGRVKPGAASQADAEEWSPSTFLTNYESMSPRARSIMFSDSASLRSALDDYLTVAASLRNVQKLGNPSGSASHGATWTTIGSLATATATGHFAVAGAIVAALGTGNIASRVLMSPKIVRWMTGANKLAIQTRNMPQGRADMSWRGYLRSLPAIAGNDNEIAAALTKYVEATRQAGRPEPEEPAASTAVQP